MTRRERTTLLALWFFLGLLPLWVRPLWNPDEGRYGEIPREMLASGDWLTPTLNGVLYFEKPPLQYWLSAISMKLFGLNGAAARLPLALASGLMLWAAWRMARRLGARDPRWAGFMVITGLLGFLVGQLLTLDALFSAFLVAGLTTFLEAVCLRREGRGAGAWIFATFVLVAAALLTKGPAALILLGGVFIFSLPFAWKDAALRRAVLGVGLNPLGWLLLVALTAPWFWAVNRANPGHAQFFFIHEHVTRFLTHEHARQGSNNWLLDKLYFVGILAVGLLPWVSATAVGLRRAWAFLRHRGPRAEDGLARWTVAFAFTAFLWPLAFFSLSGSKLPPYILPVLVPLAALACTFEREGEEFLALHRLGKELLILGGVLLLATVLFRKDMPGSGTLVALVGLGLGALGLLAHGRKGLSGPQLMGGLGLCLFLLVLAVQGAVGPGKSARDLVRGLPANAQWISYGDYFQTLPFYTHQRVVVVAGTGELAYGRDHLAEPERWFPEDPKALGPVASRLQSEAPERPVLVMAKVSTWRRLDPTERAAWDLVATRGPVLVARRR